MVMAIDFLFFSVFWIDCGTGVVFLLVFLVQLLGLKYKACESRNAEKSIQHLSDSWWWGIIILLVLEGKRGNKMD